MFTKDSTEKNTPKPESTQLTSTSVDVEVNDVEVEDMQVEAVVLVDDVENVLNVNVLDETIVVDETIVLDETTILTDDVENKNLDETVVQEIEAQTTILPDAIDTIDIEEAERDLSSEIHLQLRRGQLFYLPFKRIIDFVGAFFALLILLIPFLIVAIIIKIDSKGPIFFIQTRVGRRAKPFQIYKFRSMNPNAEAEKCKLIAKNENAGTPFFKIKKDPRVTKVGHVLRKYSIDELPQFWNVLKGDMSLVGPRPALYEEVKQYTPKQLQNLVVKPGLTCFWQVGDRSKNASCRITLDSEYISAMNFLVDIRVLLKTPISMIKHRGAY